MSYHTMLQYFGFYDTPPEPTSEAPAEPDPPREAAVAHGARLANRYHHTPPSAVPTTRAWDSSSTLERWPLER